MVEHDTKGEHVTPEMIALISEFAEAKAKDDKMVMEFRKRQQRAKEAWEKKSEKQKQQLILEGREFKELPDPPSKWVRAYRRKVRYRLFRIRDGREEFDKGLKKWMELQFRDGMTWGTYTFEWDVSFKDPLRVIEPMEWDGEMILDQFSKKKICDPAAFTNQAA